MNARIKKKITLWANNLKSLSGTDRLEYIIELGRRLNPLESNLKIESFRIHGCASNLWLVPKFKADILTLAADADAFITKGTAYMVLDCLSGERCGTLSKIKREHFAPLGMAELLSVQRQNGLGLLIAKIQQYAETHINSCHSR
jgi:cysteine desulfuration protein SufE